MSLLSLVCCLSDDADGSGSQEDRGLGGAGTCSHWDERAGLYFCSASSIVMPGADVLVAARAATTLPAADHILSCSW